MSEPSPYDAIARLYDPWSRSVIEDVPFYVEEARAAGGPVVELGVGTGRIAVPIAAAGDPRSSASTRAEGMLEVCREQAELAGVAELVDLRLGDLREPPVEERVGLVICPFRAFLHLPDDGERLRGLEAARDLLLPGGRLVFDVFTPSAADIEETHGRWIEREPGIFERADWDEQAAHADALRARPGRRDDDGARLALGAASGPTCFERAGFGVEACYGWFDRRPSTPAARTRSGSRSGPTPL